MIEWVEDQDNVITNNALEQQFGPLGEEPADDVLEKSEQVHVALVALTESESFDIVPSEMEQHLAMNLARLIGYDQVRSEIQAYIEARRSQFAFKTVAAKNTSDPMDVDSFGKGGKKGKVDGKNGKNESKYPQESCLLALWEGRPPEH